MLEIHAPILALGLLSAPAYRHYTTRRAARARSLGRSWLHCKDQFRRPPGISFLMRLEFLTHCQHASAQVGDDVASPCCHCLLCFKPGLLESLAASQWVGMTSLCTERTRKWHKNGIQTQKWPSDGGEGTLALS